LAQNKNIVFTRDQLLEKVWDYSYMGDTRTVDVHIKCLREKLRNSSANWEIKTVWGVGYKMEVRQDV
jgi:DNA-binding response OmpR family regulator